MPSDDLRYAKVPLAGEAGAMPVVGFGTLIPDAAAAARAIDVAIEVGFRHFDCAEAYRNEDVVGARLRAAFDAGAVKRDDLFITTKLWNNNHRPERVAPAFQASLDRLQLDHVDSYLIHTPFAFRPGDEQYPRNEDGQIVYDDGVTLIDTWRAMEALVDAGRCRSIGLSDIGPDQLKDLVAVARIKPAVVQVEAHPYLPECDLLDFCRTQGIILLAFAPLGHGMAPRVVDDPTIKAIAGRLGITPAQVALAWAAQRGTAFLTTSTSPDHIAENFAISRLPDDALREIGEGITTSARFNSVVHTGMPGFIPQAGSVQAVAG